MKNRFYAALLSIVMPGLGQLYNRQFLKAIIIIIFEHFINELTHLNLALMLCLNGRCGEALQMIDYGYALFYPGFYTFCLMDAVFQAKDNPNKNSVPWFVLSGLIGCLGIIYSRFIPLPVFTVGLVIIIFLLLGTFVCAKND